jgi:hypothetical protein
MLEDLNDTGLDANSKQERLEAAMKIGKIKEQNEQITITNNKGQNPNRSSFSSSSSDEAEEEADQVDELTVSIKKVNNKMTAETINEIKKRHSVHLTTHYTALQGDELMEVNIVGNRLSIAKLLN